MRRNHHRVGMVALGMSVFYFALICRLAFLQLIRYPSLSSQARSQHFFNVKIEPRRGDILDRCGRPIALSLERKSIYAHPYKVRDKARTAVILSSILNMDKKVLFEKLSSDAPFVWLKRKVENYEYEALNEKKIEGIGHIEEARRYYPQGALGSSVIGFVGMDNKGLEGIEKRFDGILAGFPGEYQAARDAYGKEISSYIFRLNKPVEGASIHLTIDSVIQNIAEEALERTVAKTKAKGGTVIILAPASGEILAMASYPSFDPNNFNLYPQTFYRNQAISFVYEPGSTFKSFTAAAALEEKLFKTSDRIYCEDGAIRFASHTIHDHDPYGWLTFSETVEKSSNIGLLKIGQKVGKEKFYEYIRAFGFGEETGVEAPGEEKGIVPPLRVWKPITLATVSFGQGIAVTPIQMASAYGAIANGGILKRPYIAKEIIGPEGSLFKRVVSRDGKRVISIETSFRMREILKNVAKNGTGSLARIDGLEIAGKTGTAQKVNPAGGYSDKYMASFIGFLPADDAKVLIGVFIDEPKGLYYGGIVAAPCFREIGERVYGYLRIDEPQERIYMSAAPGRVDNGIRD